MGNEMSTKRCPELQRKREMEETRKVDGPLADTHEVVATRTLVHEGSDAEPRGLLVVSRAGGGRDGVSENLATSRGRAQLWGGGQVADDGHFGYGSRRRAAEGTGGARGGDGAAGEERHGDVVIGCVREGLSGGEQQWELGSVATGAGCDSGR